MGELWHGFCSLKMKGWLSNSSKQFYLPRFFTSNGQILVLELAAGKKKVWPAFKSFYETERFPDTSNIPFQLELQGRCISFLNLYMIRLETSSCSSLLKRKLLLCYRSALAPRKYKATINFKDPQTSGIRFTLSYAHHTSQSLALRPA